MPLSTQKYTAYWYLVSDVLIPVTVEPDADGFTDKPSAQRLEELFGEKIEPRDWKKITYSDEKPDPDAPVANNHAKWPIVSNAAGVHPSQVDVARKMYPHHIYRPDGRMIFTSQAHQRRCLADIGMRNKDDYMR